MTTYDYGVVGVLYASLHVALMASVRYWLYRDRLRVPLKWMILLLAAITTFSGGLWIALGGIPGLSFDIYRVILALLMFALSCHIIQAPVSEHAFSYAFILAYEAAVETTAFYAQVNFLSGATAYAYPLICMLITALTIFPAVRSLKHMIARLSTLGSDRVWAYLDLACFSFLFMNLLTTLPHPKDINIFYPVGRYLMLLGMAGIYRAAIRMMDALRTAADARAELGLTKRRVAMQQDYYDRMIAQMDEVRRLRHDMRHHRAALSALIKSGDAASLRAYLSSLGESEETILPVSGNLAADSILLYYLDAARQLGAELETEISISGKLPVSDPDLCVILGNLLENAVEAQKYVEPERRHIRVTARSGETGLALAVDNRFQGAVNRDINGAFLSRKGGEEHGLGIGSVRAVCEKYGGILQIETEGDLFMAGVVIGI